MGYQHPMEMGLFHSLWGRIWTVWTLYCVWSLSFFKPSPTSYILTWFPRWAHELCSEDNEERALVVGSMNEMAYLFQAWIPQIAWKQTDAPEYTKGYIAVCIISVVLIITTFVVRWLERWENEKRFVYQHHVIHVGYMKRLIGISPTLKQQINTTRKTTASVRRRVR